MQILKDIYYLWFDNLSTIEIWISLNVWFCGNTFPIVSGDKKIYPSLLEEEDQSIASITVLWIIEYFCTKDGIHRL